MEKTKRYECDMDGWEDNFVVLSTRWSKTERAAFWNIETTDEDFAVLLQNKVGAVHLERVHGEPLTDAADFSADELQDLLPEALTTWLYYRLAEMMQELNNLGEAQRRQFFDTLVSQAPEPVAAETPTTADAPVASVTMASTNADKAQSPTPS